MKKRIVALTLLTLFVAAQAGPAAAWSWPAWFTCPTIFSDF